MGDNADLMASRDGECGDKGLVYLIKDKTGALNSNFSGGERLFNDNEGIFN